MKKLRIFTEMNEEIGDSFSIWNEYELNILKIYVHKFGKSFYLNWWS